MLFILDEVQTGMGLTGTMWAFQGLGVTPDLFAFGKNRPELDTLKPLELILLRNYDVVAEFPNGATALRRKPSAPACEL